MVARKKRVNHVVRYMNMQHMQFEKARANLFPKVDLNIKKAQVKQKSHYDQRHACIS